MVEHLHRVSFSAERTPRYEMLDGKSEHKARSTHAAIMRDVDDGLSLSADHYSDRIMSSRALCCTVHRSVERVLLLHLIKSSSCYDCLPSLSLSPSNTHHMSYLHLIAHQEKTILPIDCFLPQLVLLTPANTHYFSFELRHPRGP